MDPIKEAIAALEKELVAYPNGQEVKDLLEQLQVKFDDKPISVTNHPKSYGKQMPGTFTIETILGCDLSCPECALGGGFITRKKGWMKFDQFKIIADKIRPFCEYLYLHIWGEPLLNKDIFQIIKYASTFTKTNISTNGNLLTMEKAEKLIRSGVTDIIVSIDGVSQEVYEKYRVGGSVENAVDALKNMHDIKTKLDSRVNIMPQFIVFEHNQHEMRAFQELCHSIRLKPSFKAPYLRNQNSRFSPSDYPEFTRPVYDNMEELQAAMAECSNAKNVFTILIDGSVVVCCHDHGKATCFGNIFKQRVEDIWNSQRFRKTRHNILSGKAPKFCIDSCMTWFLEKTPKKIAIGRPRIKDEKNKLECINKVDNKNQLAADLVKDLPNNMRLDEKKINLCSGSVKIDGFVNIDFLPGADIVLDLEKDLLPFSANSVDVVVCNSAINYFCKNRAQEIITDIYRVLRPGGVVRFGTQDLRALVEKYIYRDMEFYFQKLPDGKERFPGDTIGDKLNEFFYGFGIKDKHCRYLYDFESLKILFQNAGFRTIEQKKYKESLIPEVGMIDNRADQMFFLEAIKDQGDAIGSNCEEGILKQTTADSAPQIIRSSQDDFEIIRNKAFCKWDNGQPEAAWQYFVKALELNPDDRATVNKCIEILENLGRYEDILKVYKNYLKKKPDDQDVLKSYHCYENLLKSHLPDPHIISQRRAALIHLNSRVNRVLPDEEHLNACLQWLLRAQRANTGGGVSSIYRMDEKRWDADYPKTTGYIIPTLLAYYKYSGIESYLLSAIEMGEWEVNIQAPCGGVGEPLGVFGQKPRVFNTGQVLFGWIALYKETGDSKYLHVARKAANWIIGSQDPDGKWTRNTYMGPRAYHSRVAWGLLELYNITKEKKYQTAAVQAIQWVLSLGHQNGWFEQNSLTTPNRPWTHLIGYVLVGLLESCLLSSHSCHSTRLLSMLSNAAKNLSSCCNKYREKSENGCLKTLPGTFDESWMSNDRWTCLTGNAQIAFFLRKMFTILDDEPLIVAADHLIENLKMIHLMDGITDSNLYGGLTGSYPIGGDYASYAIPNWGVKFFADTLLLRMASFSDQKYLG